MKRAAYLQVAWTPRHVVIYPAICSLAGLVAGMFGVGGGIIKVLQCTAAPPFPPALHSSHIAFREG